jgi:hypothetical protein
MQIEGLMESEARGGAWLLLWLRLWGDGEESRVGEVEVRM